MQEKGNVAIGIDLGTTFSCIAVFKNNKIEVIPNEIGDSTTPSIVTFSGNKIYSGEETLRIQTRDPKNTIYGVKRLIGKYFEDREVQDEIKKYWTFTVDQGEKQDKGCLPVIVVDYEGKKQKFSPEDISALILAKLKRSAERHLKTKVDNCVVTIPAHFREEQKNATIEACKKAGFKVLGTLNEPEAAALAFGFEGKNRKDKNANENENGEKLILVFDLGGGTFDVSILKYENLKFKVIEKFGDPHFGGEDFDNALVNYCIDKFYEMKKIIIDKDKDPDVMKRLKMACESAKKILSSKNKIQIELNCLKNNEDLSLEISRDLFEEICGHLFDKCINPISELLQKLNISQGNIDEVILIGGSTKIPRIRRMLKSIFFREPNTFINPDEAVASGAAIMAAKLSGVEGKEIKDILIKDITPFTLGIAVFNDEVSRVLMLLNFLESLNKPEKLDDKGIKNIANNALLMSTVIKKGSPIPYDNTEQYHTVHDNQEEVEFEVYEGESTLVKENNLLGKFRVKNLPKKKAGEVKFDVNFKIDSNGILTVTAQMTDDKNKKEQLIVETYKGGVSKNEFNLLEKVEKNNTKDDKFFKMRDLRIEMNQYYQQIINPKKNIEDEDDEEDEEEKLKRKEEEKFDLLKNYSHTIEEFISLFDKKDLENEVILEKIFDYLKKLFESYRMALQLKSQVNNDFQKEIINKVAEYFSKFFESKIFWLQDLLDVFIGTEKKFFYEIAINLMQLFMIKGQLYSSETKRDNFNKYYAKQYFKGALEIIRKYDLDKDINRIERKKKEQYEQMKNKCIAGIHNLDAEFLIESENSLSSNKLVDDKIKSQKEKLYSLLDIFLEHISKLEGLDDNESYRIIALCYANIVKIEYKLLGNKNKLKIIRDYGVKCKEISERIESIKHKSWFKEFFDIQRELEEEIRFKEEEKDNEKIKIKEKMQEELNKISRIAKEKRKVEFIKYIIDNYPPNGYKKEDDYVKRFNKNPEKTLEDLTTVYHTSNYHGKDIPYERYLIIEQIETELNKMKTNKD
jgi:molecular chaperone DnaK (HSP70)